MNNDNKYVRMFSNCIPVLGKKRSAIYDLQRKQMFTIPSDLYNFIELFEQHTVSEIFDLCGKDNKDVVEEYFQFLASKELTFLIDTDEKELFPKLNLSWKSPSKITNAIIEISEVTEPFFEKILKYLTALGCEHLYVKILVPESFATIKNIAASLSNTSIFSVVFETKFNTNERVEDYEQHIIDNKRIDTIFLLSEKQLTSKSPKIIIASPSKFKSRKECFFTVNLSLFTESQEYNTYFNEKIFINKKGVIRNAPETKDVFGNISDITFSDLEKIINSEQFQKFWRVNKDVISECKDCELRYMCVDNRVPEISKEGSYFFTSKCELKN